MAALGISLKSGDFHLVVMEFDEFNFMLFGDYKLVSPMFLGELQASSLQVSLQ